MGYAAFMGCIKSPALVAVAEHWAHARSGRRIPGWRDIDPAAIKAQLPFVWSWRWDQALGTFICRLAGEEVIAFLGLSPRGKRLEECFSPEAYRAILQRYRRVIDGPAFMHSEGKVYVLAGGQGSGERIGLPLAADGVRCDGIFGATLYRVDIRPLLGEASVERVNQAAEFFPLD